MTQPIPTHPSVSVLRGFLNSEAAGGLVLMATAMLALIVANSPLSATYFAALDVNVLGLSVLYWINDALMSVFFLLVGLEIKREVLNGQLSTWPRRVLPGIAALGGMAVPALIYISLNWHQPETLRGWAIPAATDIAFALGVLSLLGPRVPASLKVFLTALAILDDFGAVAIIALFYTSGLSTVMLGLAALTLGVLIAMNRFGVLRVWPYLLTGAVLWCFVLESGVHATLAGVALAFTIPMQPTPTRPDDRESPLHILEHALQPWVAFVIVPIFGFANAGVSLGNMDAAALLGPVPVGIALGLFIGKQLGVIVFAMIAIRAGIAHLPANATWYQLYGVALLCGIGFSMSLFIGLLAFPSAQTLSDATKIGVLAGSLASALAGTLLLRIVSQPPATPSGEGQSDGSCAHPTDFSPVSDVPGAVPIVGSTGRRQLEPGPRQVCEGWNRHYRQHCEPQLAVAEPYGRRSWNFTDRLKHSRRACELGADSGHSACSS